VGGRPREVEPSTTSLTGVLAGTPMTWVTTPWLILYASKRTAACRSCRLQ
jgi:hypothetical protein